MDDILDIKGVAAMFNVELETVYKWLQRHTLPDPAGRIGRSPFWTREQLETWGRQTKRNFNAMPARTSQDGR